MHDDVAVTRALRVAAVGLALVAGAWFVLGWVQARDAGRAAALLSATSSPTAARAAEIRSLLSSAGTLNPDRAVDLLRARLAFDRHDDPAAIKITEGVTRSEPQNAVAWGQLGLIAGAAGRIGLAQQAGHHVAALVPNT
jgi:hypothetical protein